MLDALAGRHNSGLLRKLPKHLEPALLQTMALAGGPTILYEEGNGRCRGHFWRKRWHHAERHR